MPKLKNIRESEILPKKILNFSRKLLLSAARPKRDVRLKRENEKAKSEPKTSGTREAVVKR